MVVGLLIRPIPRRLTGSHTPVGRRSSIPESHFTDHVPREFPFWQAWRKGEDEMGIRVPSIAGPYRVSSGGEFSVSSYTPYLSCYD